MTAMIISSFGVVGLTCGFTKSIVPPPTPTTWLFLSSIYAWTWYLPVCLVWSDVFTVYLIKDSEGKKYLKTWDFDSQDFYYRTFVEGKDMLQQIYEMFI